MVRGDSHDDHTCPDVILLDDNLIAVIGEILVGDDAARTQAASWKVLGAIVLL